MCSADVWFVAGLLGLALAFVAPVGLVLAFVRAGSLADRRDEQLQAAQTAPCGCEPEPELPTLGVQYHPADAEQPMRALLEAERTGRDEVSVILAPIDGGDQAAIHMPRATADVFEQLLAHARNQEVRHDG